MRISKRIKQLRACSPERRYQSACWRSLGDTLFRQGKVRWAERCYILARQNAA